MAKFIMVGENIHCIAPKIRDAMDNRVEGPILERAEAQLKAGATYLDFNIGPKRKGSQGLMAWGVQLLQSHFDNVPIALDTADIDEINSGIKVYNRAKGKPIVNSADAGDRIKYLDVAADNDAIVFALCSKEGVPGDNDEREQYLQEMLEVWLTKNQDPSDIWFDPLFVVIKGMQDKQKDVLNFIRTIAEQGLNSTGGLSNVSNGMPKEVRPIVNAHMIAMSIAMGLTSAIVNPCEEALNKAVKTADIIMDNNLYADSFLDM
jgi:5-methyltetrahydrofolate corrinoid/iron sulfur protein methyltransferase